jgi:hypothetical protein
MSRIPYFLDNPITEGVDVVSFTRQPRSTCQKHFLILISVRTWVNHMAKVRQERLGKVREERKKTRWPIRIRTRGLSARSIVPQPSTLQHAVSILWIFEIELEVGLTCVCFQRRKWEPLDYYIIILNYRLKCNVQAEMQFSYSRVGIYIISQNH